MERRSAVVGLHVAVMLWGIAALFGKWLALPPVWIVLGRTIVASTTLALVRIIQRDRWPAFDWRLAASGAVLALHWVSFFAAIQIANVATGLLGYATFPLFVLVLEWLVLKRRWTFRQGATALLASVGLVLLVPELSWANRVVQGLAWGVLSGFTFALLTVINRRWVGPAEGRPERGLASALDAGERSELGRSSTPRSAMDVAFWQDAWAAVTLLPFALLGAALPAIGYREIALLLLLGVVCTALAHTLFIASLKTLSAHTASVVAALEPVYGIALALILLGEIPGWRTLAGAILIVGAALSATWRDSGASQQDSIGMKGM